MPLRLNPKRVAVHLVVGQAAKGKVHIKALVAELAVNVGNGIIEN